MSLSMAEYLRFKHQAIDPKGLGPLRNPTDNVDLTDERLSQITKEGVSLRKPVFKLLHEYERRLKQRGLWVQVPPSPALKGNLLSPVQKDDPTEGQPTSTKQVQEWEDNYDRFPMIGDSGERV